MPEACQINGIIHPGVVDCQNSDNHPFLGKKAHYRRLLFFSSDNSH